MNCINYKILLKIFFLLLISHLAHSELSKNNCCNLNISHSDYFYGTHEYKEENNKFIPDVECSNNSKRILKKTDAIPFILKITSNFGSSEYSDIIDFLQSYLLINKDNLRAPPIIVA